MSKLKQLLSLPPFKYEDEQQRSRVILGMILFYWFSGLTVFIMDQVWGDKSLTPFLIISCVLQIIPFIFLFNGKLSISSITTATIYLVFITIFASKGLGIRDYALMAYPAVILFAGITEKRRGLIISTLLTVACLAWLVLGEQYGWLSIFKPFQPDWTDLIASGLLIATSTLMGYMLIENLEASHNRTRQELARRVKIQNDLISSQENLQALIENTDGVIWSVDTQYRLLTGNTLYRRNVSAAIGRELHDGENVINLDLSGDATSQWKAYYDRALNGEKFNVETFSRSTPSQNIVEYHFNPISDSSGQIIGVTVFGQDIVERKQAEQALHQQKQLLQTILDSVPAHIFCKDREGRHLFVSQTLADATGIPAEQWVGKTIAELLPKLAKKYQADDAYVLTTGKAIRNIIEEYETTSGVSWAQTDKVPFHDTNGEVAGLIDLSVDITERKQAEDAIERGRKLLASTLDILPVGVCLTDEGGYYRMMNDEYCKIYEYKREEMLGQHYSVIMPPDQVALANAHYARMLGGDLGIPVECKRQRKDGSIVYIEAANALVEDVDGHKMIITTVRDITERKQAEVTLRKSEAHFREVFDNTAHGTFIVDVTEDGNFRIGDSNKAEEILTSIPREAVTGKLLKDAFPLEVASTLHTNYSRAVKAGEAIAYEEDVNLPGVGPRSYYTTLAPVRDATGRIYRIIGSTLEITERKQMEEALRDANEKLRTQLIEINALKVSLQEQVIRDPLTDMYNRRYLADILERELSRANREKHPISFIMMDIDHFKAMNDTYGHQIGDKFLMEIANLLRTNARGSDIICRIGGEEFLLVLPGTTLKSAAKRAEEIRQLCAEITIQSEQRNLTVTLSFGVSTYPGHGRDFDEIIDKADKALYTSKEKGRNCVTVWNKKG